MAGEIASPPAPSRDAGLVALLRASIAPASVLHLEALEPLVPHAFNVGFGPLLAHVAARAPGNPHWRSRAHAADLTARALTQEKLATLVEVLGVAQPEGIPVLLLKGAAAALRYYPTPHLRTMGDLDLLVPAERQPLLEEKLRKLGFRQISTQSPDTFVGRHHSMPFCHPDREVWIDVHTKLFPRQFPLAHDPRFSWAAVAPWTSRIAIDDQTALVMSPELQLVYTSARWAERFEPYRGMWPVWDVVLLLHETRGELDWERVVALAGVSWAATSLRLMLTYVSGWGLADVPEGVLEALARTDPHLAAASIRLLHRITTRYAMQGRPFGPAITEEQIRLVWATLVRPRAPLANLVSVPYYLAFPPGDAGRFSLFFAMRRLRSFTRRVFTNDVAKSSTW